MKVLHINTFDCGGGAEQFALDICSSQPFSHLLVKEKLTENQRVIAFSKSWKDALFFFLDKVFWKIGFKKEVKKKLFLSERLNDTYLKLSRLNEYKNADIIHLHNIHGNYFDLSALEKIAKEKKIVWTMHDMWVMTGGEAHTFEFEGYQSGNAISPYINVAPLDNPWIDRRQYYLERKKALLKNLKARLTLIPVSDWLASCMKKSYVFSAQNNLVTIKNGVNSNIFFNREERKWSKPRILFFNSLNKFKGCETFITVADQIKHDCEIWVVGQPIKSLVPPNIEIKLFDRVSDRKLLNDLFNSIDILVFPSLAENFPLTLLEAASAGVFLIASVVGGVPEIVQKEYVGLLFQSANSKDLLTQLNIALNNINQIREDSKLRSGYIKEQFSWRKMVDEYNKLYSKISINKL
jgi:glycosyltransferase involved in cell wall biosynthesis